MIEGYEVRAIARLSLLFITGMSLLNPLNAQDQKGIPAQLNGRWRIQRILPTRTVSCWSDREARRIVGTEIEYSPTVFRWKNHSVLNPVAASNTLTSSDFHDQFSGRGAAGSQLDLRELGINASSVTIVSIQHPAADITGATDEIPGDSALLKSSNRIVISVCNVYFEAYRSGAPSRKAPL